LARVTKASLASPGSEMPERSPYVRGKDRHAGARQALRQHLQGDGLAGAGGAGHQPVAVGQRKGQKFRLGTLADEDRAVLVDL